LASFAKFTNVGIGEIDNNRTYFFATGDLGYLDNHQELHLVGRKSFDKLF